MNSIQSIRKQFHKQFLTQQLKSFSRVKRRVVNRETARSIGILFDATNPSQRDQVQRFAEKLKKEGKRVKMLGFFNSKLQNSNYIFKSYNKKDIDWALRPKGENIDWFCAQTFDIMFNLSPDTNTHTEYIAALSRAHMKVGPYTENTYCYDLMIDTSGSKSEDLNQFIREVERLLLKTNQVIHEPANV